jgi:biopolymer transport protein ExbD
MAVVRITRDGRVLLEAKPVSINELTASIEKEGLRAPFELRADGGALWMHVQWVMAALGQAGHESARCTVQLDGGRGSRRLEIPLNTGLWEDKFPVYGLDSDENPEWLPSRLAHVAVVPLDGSQEAAPQAVEYHFLENLWHEVGKSQHPESIGKWATSFLERTREEKNYGVYFAVEAAGAVQYQDVVAAIAELQGAGIREVEVGLEALHPWDRDKRGLPPPPYEELIPRWFLTDLSVKRIYPVNLPVASKSVHDKDDDPDDRLIFNLTSTGRLIYGEKDITLADLATALQERAKTYDLKMRARGKQGFDTFSDGRPWSKLYVLLRADQDSPLQHVQWVMAELSENGYYKLQFGARKRPGREYTEAEAERLWAAWEIQALRISFTDKTKNKLQCFLPTRTAGTESPKYIDVEVVGTPPRFRLGERETSEGEVLAKWIKDAYLPEWRRGHRIGGRILAAPRTPFGDVVSALNAFAMAHIEKVDFAGVGLAPEVARKAERLPDVR